MTERKPVVTKNDLVAAARNDLGLTLVKAEETVGWLFEAIMSRVADGHGIMIKGFGSFHPYHKPSTEGVSPRGTPFKTEGKTSVVFRPGEVFLARLKKPG